MSTEGTISTLLAACAEKASSVSLREGFALLERDALHRHPIDIALPLIVLVGGVGGSADFECDGPVRFDTDQMEITIETYDLARWADIPVVEIRL